MEPTAEGLIKSAHPVLRRETLFSLNLRSRNDVNVIMKALQKIVLIITDVLMHD